MIFYIFYQQKMISLNDVDKPYKLLDIIIYSQFFVILLSNHLMYHSHNQLEQLVSVTMLYMTHLIHYYRVDFYYYRVDNMECLQMLSHLLSVDIVYCHRLSLMQHDVYCNNHNIHTSVVGFFYCPLFKLVFILAMCEVIRVLQQQKIHVSQEREKLLQQLESKYMYYIHSLLLQKTLIAANITKKYDKMLNNINNSIYNYTDSIIEYNGGMQLLEVETDTIVTQLNSNETDDSNQLETAESQYIRNIPPLEKTNLKHYKSNTVHCDPSQKLYLSGVNLKCIDCDKLFDNHENFQNHMKIKHNNLKPYLCNKCNQGFRKKGEMVSHIRCFHNQQTRFECDVCHKRFYFKNDLKRHYRIHTGEKPYKCNICNKAFTRNYEFTIHKRIDHGEKPNKKKDRRDICHKKIECKQCHKTFSTKSVLTTHIRSVHNKETRFECDVCHKGFYFKSHCKQHYKIHTGEKPYKCNICCKAFARNHDYKDHYRIHTGEKPYKCIVCNKSFSSTSNKGKHQKKCMSKKQAIIK
eukprot:90921_1